ncbi:MAG: sigma-54-dependent Fis family transcriptional regulator [Deltaproteobacteria bacterium]|nr:sigma-54-dependent Fis family transcriptional regulator [Deltaproteobacteria bacterium]
MRSVLERVARVCQSEAPVLITGESGTGKELVARALHFGGPRRDRAFVAVNCAAFPDTLIESELFGHSKGAFTGAVARREGRFKLADRGTLFLDEIGELSLSAQAKLLRVIQEGTIEPLGHDGTIHVDVRILSATHRDLAACIAKGSFREDLYYRLKVLHIQLPPLRGRAEDLPVLVDHLVKRYAPGNRAHLTQRAQEVLASYPFPGNVRELENVIQHALVMANGRDIDVGDLPGELLRHVTSAGRAAEPEPTENEATDYAPLPLADARRVFERAYLVQVLGQNRGRRAETAKALKISRKGLWEKLRDHGIQPEEYGGAPDRDEDDAE